MSLPDAVVAAGAEAVHAEEQDLLRDRDRLIIVHEQIDTVASDDRG